VGLLASFADLTGALGTGTGILLTVGILHKMYEDLSAQHMFDLYPQLRGFIG
jgi:preprotein translocase subunit SecY